MVGGMLVIMNALTAYTASSTAGFLNVLAMRAPEVQKGIYVFDPDNKEYPVALSKSAARKAVL